MSTRPQLPPNKSWHPLLLSALDEDIGSGDVTSNIVVPQGCYLDCALEARQDLVLCGIQIAKKIFASLESKIIFAQAFEDGDHVTAGEKIARIKGPAHPILAGERTALNFLQRMSGVATNTRRLVDIVTGTGAVIMDTRKTIPGWRALDKYAVLIGGGTNHRHGLYDALLIKDNHIVAAGGIAKAVETARSTAPSHLWLQVEVENEAQAEEAVAAGADSLLLDNQSIKELAHLAKRFRQQAVLEASGGISSDTLKQIAETGVHRISVGALTHSSSAIDLALEVINVEGTTT